MRETVVYQFCDVHAAEDERVPATASRQVTLDGFPAKVLDLCETCDKELFERLMVLLDTRAASIHTDSPGKDVPVDCELCGNRLYGRSGLLQHLRKRHGAPATAIGPCPMCGRDMVTAQSAATHLTKAHGLDTVEQAYANIRKATG